jgi:hypothetical protein
LADPSIAYVDKTAQLLPLIAQPTYNRAFFSRPRKWGKSVTVDTLDYLFRGERELFEVCVFCVFCCVFCEFVEDCWFPVFLLVCADFSHAHAR